MENIYAALKWLSANTDDFGVGSAGVVICCDSASSGIAEERGRVALLASVIGLGTPIAKRVLIYTMLADHTIGRHKSD